MSTYEKYKIEIWFYSIGWLIETLLVKYWIEVESWWISFLLAITVGSVVLKLLQHVPDIID